MVETMVAELFVGEDEFFLTAPGQVDHHTHWHGARPDHSGCPGTWRLQPSLLLCSVPWSHNHHMCFYCYEALIERSLLLPHNRCIRGVPGGTGNFGGGREMEPD